MRFELRILRQASPEQPPGYQCIPLEAEPQMTVAAALNQINSAPELRDTEGNPVIPIRWECSCMQKKCGACAIRINGRPRLACDAKLSEFSEKQSVTLEPLHKFPVVADLIVDRSVMMDQLLQMEIWFTEETKADETVSDLAYDAARCLQCGCCLEICPNFYAGGAFFGMASQLPAARILSALPEAQKSALYRNYRNHIYEGCGKSLACRDICPAGIEMDRLLVHSNAAAVWNRRFSVQRKKRK